MFCKIPCIVTALCALAVSPVAQAQTPESPSDSGAAVSAESVQAPVGMPESVSEAAGTDGAAGDQSVNIEQKNEKITAKNPPQHETDKSICDENFTYANALMRAENAYVRRRYTTVIEILRPLYERIQCIDDTNSVIEIDLLLGVAYFEQENKSLADIFFLNVLRSDPDHVVGSIITLPESSARRIEELRSEHAGELDILRAKSSPNTIIESLYVLVEKEKHPYWINFVPFGAGLFQQHDIVWGSIYASTQLAGIALTILGGGMVEYYRSDKFTYNAQDRARAQNWQNAQIVGIAVLCASYVANLLHALITYEESTLIIHSPSQTRPDIAHRAAPFIIPDGGGVIYETVF